MERVPKPEWGWYYTLRLVLAPRASNIVSLQLGPGDVDDVIILAGFDGLRDTKDEVEAFDAADNQRNPCEDHQCCRAVERVKDEEERKDGTQNPKHQGEPPLLDP